MSERHACRLLGQWRGTQRYEGIYRTDEDALTRAIITLASEYGRYGYRRITVELQKAGWLVGKDRVQRIWRREGLKVPQKQRPRGRLWLNDGSCVRLRPERANHVWAYDFVKAMTHDGRALRLLVLLRLLRLLVLRLLLLLARIVGLLLWRERLAAYRRLVIVAVVIRVVGVIAALLRLLLIEGRLSLPQVFLRGGDQAEIMLGVLVVVFGRDRIA